MRAWTMTRLALVGLLCVFGCAQKPPKAPIQHKDIDLSKLKDPPAQKGAKLDCKRLGYPCSLNEESDEASKLSMRLTKAVIASAYDDPPKTVVTWLKAQPGVIEANLNKNVVVFRVKGAMPRMATLPRKRK